jgi:hypothetical protein
MARTAKVLNAGAQLTTSAATYYTVPALTTAIIQSVVLTNTTAGAVTATVHLVTSGGTATALNMVLSAKSLVAGETYIVPGTSAMVLATGGTLQALASANTSISLMASGTEIVA